MRGKHLSFILSVFFIVLGCKPQTQSGSKTSADTAVGLERLKKHFTIGLELSVPVDQINSTTEFKLVAVKTSDGPNSKRYGVYYIDRSPNNPNALVAMSYRLTPSFDFNVEPRVFHVYLDLERESPSYQKLWQTDPYNRSGWYGPYSNYQRIYIGRAKFSNSSPTIAEVKLASLLDDNKSLIVADTNFAGNGQIGLHYVEGQIPTTHDPSEPSAPTPGNAPKPKLDNLACAKQSQCTAIPMEEVCGTKNAADRCRPPRLTGAESINFAKGGSAADMKSLGEGSFALRPSVGIGKIFFASNEIAATKGNNEKFCEEKLGFLIRDGGNIADNPACRIARLPSLEPKNGKLYCGISVSFEAPRDVQEFTCNITGVFRDTQKELQSVQVIYGETAG